MESEEKKYATIYWTPQDVIDEAKECDLEFTEQQAVDFLEKHQDRIVDWMCSAGWDAIRFFLFEDKDYYL